uniref:Ig-like domain-containing protein n=1 Tax=Romanomermis culicivorax TaxID=13658 RepID=A0A915J731_ROMCU
MERITTSIAMIYIIIEDSSLMLLMVKLIEPPKHIKENITKTVHVDDTLEVPCRDSKRMDADIYWTFNGSKISSDSHLLDAPFLIKIVTENNTGQYVCHAKNKVGEAVRVVNVQVIQVSAKVVDSVQGGTLKVLIDCGDY